MLLIRKIPFRPHRKPPQASAPAPPGALVLVSAEYLTEDGPQVMLTFDRPINIASLHGNQFTLIDNDISGWKYHGTGGILSSPAAVLLGLTQFQSAAGDGIFLTASNTNGIIAAGDGAAWSGVTNLSLPYP